VAVRICPQCTNVVPVTRVAASWDAVECPHCQTKLEVEDGSRIFAVWIGLIAAFLVWYASRMLDGDIGWVLPEVYSIFTFGVVAALIDMFTARLRVARAAPPIPSAAGHGHAGAHGAGHGGAHA